MNINSYGYSFLIIFFITTLLISFLPLPFYVFHIIAISIFYAYLCTSWAIVGGFARQVSLGHSAFVGVGAYSIVISLRIFNLPLILGAITAIFIANLVALLLGYACFRFGLRGPYFTFATMAFNEVTYLTAISLREITGGSLGISIPIKEVSFLPINPKVAGYYIIIVLFVFAVFLAHKIQFSKFGYYLTAIREDEDAAVACGINVLRVKLIALCISATLSALGGVFYALYYTYITPDGVLSLSLSFQIATTALIGGAKFWFGPAIGALIIVPFTEIVRSTIGGVLVGVPLLTYGILLLIIARLAPEGISKIITEYVRGKVK
jgi:branched-chain amino acid transport system permease protein